MCQSLCLLSLKHKELADKIIADHHQYLRDEFRSHLIPAHYVKHEIHAAQSRHRPPEQADKQPVRNEIDQRGTNSHKQITHRFIVVASLYKNAALSKKTFFFVS